MDGLRKGWSTQGDPVTKQTGTKESHAKLWFSFTGALWPIHSLNQWASHFFGHDALLEVPFCENARPTIFPVLP